MKSKLNWSALRENRESPRQNFKKTERDKREKLE